MKLFVVFCALAAIALSDTVQNVVLPFSFENTDGVVVNSFTLPFNFAGSVNISINQPTNSDVLLCLHWVVPAVAPFGENIDLGTIWKKTCTEFFSVTAGGDPFSETGVTLRSGEFFFSSAVTNEDIDSTGIIDTFEYDFTAVVTFLECEGDHFGDSCAHPYSPLSFTSPSVVSLTSTAVFFALPTMDESDTNTFDLFASSLEFSFDSKDGVEYTMLYKMMGYPEDGNDGDECHVSSSCVIDNPPFTATPGFLWGVSLSASEDVDTNVSVSFKFCDKGTIGADCEDYDTLDTDVGVVKKYSKKTILVFDNSVSVAVGGLDGYEQQDTAPAVKVQVDAEPFPKGGYDVLLSEGAQANVAIIDFAGSLDSKIVLSIDPSKSFGIWKVDDATHCPNDCDEHGTCSTEEYVCVCSDKYEDLDCGHEIKDFTIEYIILIAVGSILILAILIGVPIYCYLNRNQEYDIVA